MSPKRKGGVGRAILAAFMLLVLASRSSASESVLVHPVVGSEQVQTLEVGVGKSRVLSIHAPITRLSLANPDVVDAVVLSSTQIYLTGKSVGMTTLTLWQEEGKVFAILDVVAKADVTRLKEDLHHLFPEEGGIQVRASHDHVTLSGTVSGTAVLTKVLEVAEAYAPKKIVNVLQVGGVQQVMLEVRVAEMNRDLTRRLGVNFNYSGGNNFGVTALGQLTGLAGIGDGTTPSLTGPIGQTLSSALNAAFRFRTGSYSWTALVDALQEQNLLKILAKPNLVSLSGQEAQFLLGGEFPFPVPQALALVTIQFKKFGIGLSFTPVVLSNHRISITVAPEVSELDFSGGLNVSGFQVPAISTRRASTAIELADGQSFAIAGLLRDNIREVVRKYPVLGDIPILGALFRSSTFLKQESELVIIVTPRLVKPVDLAEQPLPTDTYVEPTDFEYYMLGYVQGARRLDLPAPRTGAIGRPTVSRSVGPGGGQGRMEGAFGHIAP